MQHSHDAPEIKLSDRLVRRVCDSVSKPRLRVADHVLCSREIDAILLAPSSWPANSLGVVALAIFHYL